MQILLDTNVLLWSIDQPERLPAKFVAMLEDSSNEICFSAVNIWEVAIKARLGRAAFRYDPDQIAQAARDTNYRELSLTSAVAARVAHLPLLHGDPFDRLLIVQAMAGPMRFLTSDARLPPYSELVTLIP